MSDLDPHGSLLTALNVVLFSCGRTAQDYVDHQLAYHDHNKREKGSCYCSRPGCHETPTVYKRTIRHKELGDWLPVPEDSFRKPQRDFTVRQFEVFYVLLHRDDRR